MEPTAMQALLSDIGSVITQLLTWVGNVITTIVGQPLLLIPFAIFVVGACVGLFARLFGAR